MSEAALIQAQENLAQAQMELAHAEAKRTEMQTMAGQLSDVKGAVTTWGQTITGLAGIGGFLALMQGETTLADLPDGAQVVVVLLLLAAFAAAVVAVYQAMVAAHYDAAPDPRDKDAPQMRIEAAVGTAEGSAVLAGACNRARAHFNRSVWAGLLSLFLVALVAVGLWAVPTYMPGAPAPATFLVRYEDGTVACQAMEVGAMQDVADIEPVETC